MTEQTRDELIEKSLLKQLDPDAEALVQRLLLEDEDFRNEYHFQKELAAQVRLKRRRELQARFGEFEAQHTRQAAPEPNLAAPDDSLRTSDLAEEAPGKIIPLWRQTWFRVAASVALIAVLGTLIWRAGDKPAGDPMADRPNQGGKPVPSDTLSPKPGPRPERPTAEDRRIAQEPPKEGTLRGPRQIAYGETDSPRLGFGNGEKPDGSRLVVFLTATQPGYEFGDTLRVYFPEPPPARPAPRLIYYRSEDTYHLTVNGIRYELVKGLSGRQPLNRVAEPGP